MADMIKEKIENEQIDRVTFTKCIDCTWIRADDEEYGFYKGSGIVYQENRTRTKMQIKMSHPATICGCGEETEGIMQSTGGKIMKRLTAAILSASLVLTMMAGCGNKSEETTGEEKAITVGTNSESSRTGSGRNNCRYVLSHPP